MPGTKVLLKLGATWTRTEKLSSLYSMPGLKSGHTGLFPDAVSEVTCHPDLSGLWCPNETNEETVARDKTFYRIPRSTNILGQSPNNALVKSHEGG